MPESSRSGGMSTAVTTRSASTPNGRCSPPCACPAHTEADISDSLVRLTREPAPAPGHNRTCPGTHSGSAWAGPAPAGSRCCVKTAAWSAFPRAPRALHPAASADRPPSPAERGSPRTGLPPDRGTAACYLPPELEPAQRRFGIAAHLYSLRRTAIRASATSPRSPASPPRPPALAPSRRVKSAARAVPE